jgi:glycosyltransferase involved in cell wall biosynthesis
VGVCAVPDLWDEGRLDVNLDMKIRDRPKTELIRISRSMLETDRLDEDTVWRCNNKFDAVWVPTEFNFQTFVTSGVKSDLIKVLPESIDPNLFNCSDGPPPVRPFATFNHDRLDKFFAEGRDESTFTFLSIFKWEERKNWKMLLKTFLETFPNELTHVEPEQGLGSDITVRLLIKTQQLAWSTDPDQDLDLVYRHMGRPSGVDSRLLIVKDSLPTAMLPSLYRAVDAFVMPTHGEGWGLPLMEAMASGLPTIATGWGGHTEFMHKGNSILLGYELVDAEGGRWAQPDATQLQEAMLEAVRRTAASRTMAATACQEVPGSRFSPDAVAMHVDDLASTRFVSPSGDSSPLRHEDDVLGEAPKLVEAPEFVT